MSAGAAPSSPSDAPVAALAQRRRDLAQLAARRGPPERHERAGQQVGHCLRSAAISANIASALACGSFCSSRTSSVRIAATFPEVRPGGHARLS
jgi:hypothetical protein